MEKHRDEKENSDEEKETSTPITLETSRSYGSRETLLSDVCTDFLTVVYQEGIGSSLMAFQHSKNDKDFAHLHYEDYPILKAIQEDVIGKDFVIDTPFGGRKMVYCDFTASGRLLGFIEDYIRKHVFPTYANTHSTTGHNAIQTGKYREEARSIVKKCVNASNDDAVIFTGSGATAAVHKFAWALKLNDKHVAKETAVLTGPYEHHSNILLWREYGAAVERIQAVPETGHVDMMDLEDKLVHWKNRCKQILVCMSAASNVSGIVTDTETIATIAHKHGALVLFDYAAGGPYLKIDMNPGKFSYKDAVIISPHKFVGGPGSPGLLVAKKWIFRNSTPHGVGGGTVVYVTRGSHYYVSNIEEREEGGTPAITESIRAGLVFKLKQDVTEDLIAARDDDLCSRAFSVWEKNPHIFVLGNHAAKRLPIFSFLTKHLDSGKLVHHNFISTLLSDLFGIQARGGCACAGPYSEDLLGISESLAEQYTWFFTENTKKNQNTVPKISLQVMKPGFTRINLVYFNDDETNDYVISAIDMVTKHGWKLLPQYTFDMETGSWTHKDLVGKKKIQLKSLDKATIFKQKKSEVGEPVKAPTYKEVLAEAMAVFNNAENQAKLLQDSTETFELLKAIPRDMHHLHWFLTPLEAVTFLLDRNQALSQEKYILPFTLVPPVQRMAPDYDSDYHSAGSLLSNSSTGSEISENNSYSKVKVIRDKTHYMQSHNKELNDDREKHKITYVQNYRTELENGKLYHQHRHNNRLAPSHQYPHHGRVALYIPQGYPVVDSRQVYGRPVHVPVSQFERLVGKDRQQKDNVHKQIKDRQVPLKTSSSNTYYVRLQVKPAV